MKEMTPQQREARQAADQAAADYVNARDAAAQAGPADAERLERAKSEAWEHMEAAIRNAYEAQAE